MGVIFLHGKESGPNGSKIRMLGEAGWMVTAPDCQGIDDLEHRLTIARWALDAAQGPFALVGSSMGGLVAALLWSRVREEEVAARVLGVLLLAPALSWDEAAQIEACHPNTRILHGTRDDVIPVETSRAFAEEHGCSLTEVDDTHRLGNSHPQILAELEALLGADAEA